METLELHAELKKRSDQKHKIFAACWDSLLGKELVVQPVPFYSCLSRFCVIPAATGESGGSSPSHNDA